MTNSGGVYEAGTIEEVKRHCFALLVDNEPGILARVAGLFSGRGYNIDSLTVDEVDGNSHLSRITIVTKGSPMVIAQIEAQLGRLVPVRHVVNLTTQGKFVEGTIAFLKLIGGPEKRDQGILIARKFGARVVDTTQNAIIFELTSARDIIDKMIEQLRLLGQVEVARTGSVAMGCGEGVLEAPLAEDAQKRA
jgi:acetolactate synthase I/III small subunit